MLSEYAAGGDGLGGGRALGFEPGHGGRSYGLEELVQKEPPFSIGRVQYALTSPLLALACSSNILVLVLAGSLTPPSSSLPATPPRIVRIDLNDPDKERTVDLYAVTASSSASSSGSSAPSKEGSAATGTTSSGQRGNQTAGRQDPTSIHRLFLDPSGRHVIVSTAAGESYYFFSGWEGTVKRARTLPKLRGIVINAVSWNSPLAQSSSQVAQTTTSTKEILLGDTKGNIYECVIDAGVGGEEGSVAATALRPFGRGGNLERHFKLVYSLVDKSTSLRNATSGPSETYAITGLRSEIWAGAGAGQQQQQKRKAVVVATTATRIYQFVASVPASAANVSIAERDEGGMYDDLFKVYRDSTPKSLDLPGDVNSSELHFWQVTKDGSNVLEQPKSVAWMTGPGIYHGSISYSSQEAGDGVIDSAQLLPYPSAGSRFDKGDMDSPYPGRTPGAATPPPEYPTSMALTAHHFLLLYRDRVRVVRMLDDRVVFEEQLDLRPNEQVRAFTTDIMRKTYWLYTDSSIFEFTITDEDQDLWQVYLDKQSFDSALKFAKSPKDRNAVYAAQADAYFSQGRYIQSAEAFAQSSKPFEEVVLRFIEKEERDALRYYLVRGLERLKKNDLTQRMMLATWLVEIYLSKINQLEDIAASESASDDVENYHIEKSIIEDDFKQFLQQYKDSLDTRTVFELIASHGRSEMLLHYATVVGDYERIVAHWIGEEDWQAALLALARQDSTEPYYRYAPVLMKHVPRETVDAFMRQSALSPRRLIPSLHQIGQSRSAMVPQAIRYLEYCIFSRHSTDPAVHNTLLSLYATSGEDENELLHFLQTAPLDEDTSKPYYDLDFALRICRAHSKIQSCVEIYSKMGLYESSVDLALQSGDLELAKINAEMPRDDDLLRKKLWLKIAKHVVREKNDLKTAMQFLEDTSLLKIEDILPFFPDFITIDDFKEDICEALEGYSGQIERLKEEMNTATEAADAIRRDIAELQNRFVVVDAAAKCDVCTAQLLARQFYVFPCQHAFHADCLIKEVTQHLPPHTLRRILDLQNQIARAAKGDDAKAQQIIGSNASAESSSLDALGLVSGRKLAQASVQGLDQLRKLVIPDALVTVIGGGIMGAVGRDAAATPAQAAVGAKREPTNSTTRSKEERMRQELDDLLASSCVYCETAVVSLDRPFLADGEDEM